MTQIVSEQTLLAQSKAGEHTAFMELIRRNSKSALSAIRSIVPNPPDVEDIMQDTLLNAYRSLPYFDQRCKFSTWLTRIAINNALVYLRRRKVRAEVSLELQNDDGDSSPIQVADVRVDTEREVMRAQAATKVRKAMNELPAPLRGYMNRWCLEDLTHQQAASALGITLAAGKSRSLRARHLLESALSPAFLHPR